MNVSADQVLKAICAGVSWVSLAKITSKAEANVKKLTQAHPNYECLQWFTTPTHSCSSDHTWTASVRRSMTLFKKWDRCRLLLSARTLGCPTTFLWRYECTSATTQAHLTFALFWLPKYWLCIVILC